MNSLWSMGGLHRPILGWCTRLRQYLSGSSRSLVTSETSGGGTSTISPDEIDKFRGMSGDWWNPQGNFKALHSMNKLRVQLISNGLQRYSLKGGCEGPLPLEGLSVLDIGCGGGLLTEPLARLGAQMTGIDACKEGISVAAEHAGNQPGISDRIQYKYTTIEDFARENPQLQFDGIVASEILEHVAQPHLFVSTATAMLKEGGSFFLTTINRTNLSWIGAILGAEYLLRIVPVGTHSWQKFVSPQEFQRIASDCGLEVRLLHGMCYNPLTNDWNWSESTDINYAVHALKTGI